MEDLLIEQNRILHRTLIENNIPHIYEENEGKHEWDYWAKNIEQSLLFFNGLNK
jgi:enterochelin esterase-like enzyme